MGIFDFLRRVTTPEGFARVPSDLLPSGLGTQKEVIARGKKRRSLLKRQEIKRRFAITGITIAAAGLSIFAGPLATKTFFQKAGKFVFSGKGALTGVGLAAVTSVPELLRNPLAITPFGAAGLITEKGIKFLRDDPSTQLEDKTLKTVGLLGLTAGVGLLGAEAFRRFKGRTYHRQDF